MPAELVQIRTGYTAEWQNLAFSVESGISEWTLRVEDAATHDVLYTARRGAARAARIAAADFGIFQKLGPSSGITPERLASELTWRQFH